jgi:hypothetical protein
MFTGTVISSSIEASGDFKCTIIGGADRSTRTYYLESTIRIDPDDEVTISKSRQIKTWWKGKLRYVSLPTSPDYKVRKYLLGAIGVSAKLADATLDKWKRDADADADADTDNDVWQWILTHGSEKAASALRAFLRIKNFPEQTFEDNAQHRILEQFLVEDLGMTLDCGKGESTVTY